MTGNLKSQEEIYLRLHTQLIRSDPLELASSVNKYFIMDIKTLQSRTRNEGLAFLTKSLPKLAKSFDQALSSGRLNIPVGFKPSHKNANIPAFMQEYFSLVFDENGFLLDVASVEAIGHIRQVLYFAYKLELPYSVSDKTRVIESFISTDLGLSLSDDPLAEELLSLAKIITRKVFDGFDHKSIHPHHGPGAVATGERLDQKWQFARLFNSIHQVFPYYDYYVTGGAREITDRLDWYKQLQRHESGCAKVVLVPKDSRGPRLISCEPLEYQWIQQGLGRKLADHLEMVSTITRRHVNFSDQRINRNLAKSSSATQRFVTLDLKDASDRVSLEVVRRVFESTPQLLRALEACRTTETKLPDGRVVVLKKFAPMGSALCFPVEAFVFWVTIVSAVIIGKKLPLQRVGKRIFVYGDDIVVPTEWAALSIQALESIGLMVNRDKSCLTGFFRESCGMDAFKGTDITPVRLKKPWSGRNYDGSALQSYSSLANALQERGYESVSNLIWYEVEKLYGEIPYGTFRASFPCKVITDPLRAEALNKRRFRWKVNRRYQRIEFLLLCLSQRRRKSRLDGWHRLMRNMVAPPYGDPSYIVLPLSMSIKRGWTSVA